MMNINRLMLTGFLTRDAVLNVTKSGTQVLSAGIAVNDRRRNAQTGEWEDYPNFFEFAMFGPRAEAVSPYLLKGTKLAIEGKLRYSSWEKDGERRSRVTVIVDQLEFLSRGQSGGPAAPAAAEDASPAQVHAAEQHVDVYDEDIPY